MARPKTKSLDPGWQAERRKSRHAEKAAISIRVSPDTRDLWHAASESQNKTLKDWMVDMLNHAATQTLKAEEP